MIIDNPTTIETDYYQSDIRIISATPTEYFPDLEYVMCTLVSDTGNTYPGVCYWYKGVNKNIPFDWTPDSE